MTCQELVDFLSDYLEGELPGAQDRVFREHLERCPPCVAYLETFKRTLELERCMCEGEDAAIPGDVPENLVRAILAARERC